ncbi:MAG: ABC transporter permease [Fretibacterium sp.]|nr:ABC transporter permease [Fretibacterium sp.]
MPGLSTFGIAKKNLQRRPWRSFCLIMAILLFSFFLFAGSVLSLSLSRGAESTANRLGADIMLVPEGFDPHVDSILLSGKPSNFYLPADAMESVKALETDIGIAQMSPQTFLATLNASCCSYPVQLVGLDYDTDFIVKPWLENTLHRKLHDGEIIVGYHVTGWPGETITFFSKNLTVAGRLEQTGMGFDSMVFMNRATIAMLSKEAERIIGRPLTNDGSLTSVIMVKLRQGYDSVAAAVELNRTLNSKGIYALFSKKFVNSIGSSLTAVSWIIRGSLFLLWVLAILVVALIFALTFSERKKEMGVLRALGASRSKLLRFCLSEAFLVSAYGAALGIILGGVLVVVGSPLIKDALHLPSLLPSFTGLFLLGLGSGGAAILTGLFAAFFSAFRASRVDVYEIMRGA